MSIDPRPIVLAPHELEQALQGKLTLVVRPMKPQPVPGDERWHEGRWLWPCNAVRACIEIGNPQWEDCLASNSPFDGGKLWVRETWRVAATLDWQSPAMIADDHAGSGMAGPCVPVQYRDGCHLGLGVPPEFGPTFGKWRSPISMPRWASRLPLDVGRIEARRVQSLEESMVMDTGIAPLPLSVFVVPYLASFANWWDERFGDREERLWKANPWVWTAVVRRASR